MRIAFLHPDLGIGGAERFVVDAALGLQHLGHTVRILTSHHDKERCFVETKDGTLRVRVLGGSIIPVSISGRFKLVCAVLRQLHLVLSLSFQQARARLLNKGVRYDIFIVDQLSAGVPLLRWLTNTRVVFYCHFPDMLLSPNRDSRGPAGLLRKVYRAPLDFIEEQSTDTADEILVNSSFTSHIFTGTFTNISRKPAVLYPGIDVQAFGEPVRSAEADRIVNNTPYFLSINRFEGKKNIALAVRAFADVRRTSKAHCRLLVAGGYDERSHDNVEALTSLERIARDLGLSYSRASDLRSGPTDIIFLTNISAQLKLALLTSPSVIALLYTPENEHFGLVPIEAMAARCPVLACDSGGPKESVVDGETGFLRSADPREWSETMLHLLSLSPQQRSEIGQKGLARVSSQFSLDAMAQQLHQVLNKTYQSNARTPWQEDGMIKFIAVLAMFLLGIFLVLLL